MRVLVCEYITGGGLMGGPLPGSLRAEGEMMLTALLRDLLNLGGVEVTASRDPRLPPPGLDATYLVPCPATDPWRFWEAALAQADALWPIAPETGGALERLSALALDRGRILLGSRPAAVRICTSKRTTAACLASHGVAVVPTGTPDQPPPSASGYVAKPDDGAGAEDTLFFDDLAALRDWASRQSRDIAVQPFVPGEAASISALFRDGAAALLSCNRQFVLLEGRRFAYRGGEVGALERFRPVFADIAGRIAAALPDLWGYAGIDIVLGPEGPLVLEINPRLTTSYAGVSEALGQNAAGLVLGLLDQPLPPHLVPRGAVRVVVGGAHA